MWILDFFRRSNSFDMWGQRCALDEILSGERIQALADLQLDFGPNANDQPDQAATSTGTRLAPFSLGAAERAKLDQAEVLYVQSDQIDTFIADVLPHLTAPFSLITHNSDKNIDSSYQSLLEDRRLVSWFAQNTLLRHPKLFPLPIGLANARWRHGDLSAIVRQAQRRRKPLETAYLNFKTRTNLPVREPIRSNLSQKEGFYASRHVKHRRFLQELTQHRYCISPPGNGYDCHRTWECLYLGLVPVIQAAETDLFKGLPVVAFEDLSVITLADIQARWRAMADGPFDLRPLYLSYWAERIEEARQRTRTARASGA